jgi:glycosyltransferase involved in cell wall biosynthesis
MRLLFDCRSVRTPAGAYVFRGLTNGWLNDHRVSAVLAAVPAGFDRTWLPEGVEPLCVPAGGWLQHLRTAIPRIADRNLADIIFVPNGLPPADLRVVIYFQDLYHFRILSGPVTSLQGRAVELARAAWRRYAAPSCRLAVPVSTDIHHEVVRRLDIPIVMIPNGVDVGNARWASGGDRIVVMGGHGRRKGEDVALRAWVLVPARSRKGLRLALIGVEPSERRKELQQMAARLAIGDSVDVEGTMPRDDYLERIAASLLTISCSRMEAFGLPVAESLAMGAPLLASDLPSHRELIARAGAGESFPVGNAGALAARITAALEGDMPPRLTSAPFGWSWRDRARQHVDAYHDTPASTNR